MQGGSRETFKVNEFSVDIYIYMYICIQRWDSPFSILGQAIAKVENRRPLRAPCALLTKPRSSFCPSFFLSCCWMVVMVVDALPLRGFCSLSSILAHQHGARNTATFFLTLLSVYRVSHVKCCVQAILFEIIAGIDALFRLNLNLNNLKINNIYLKNFLYILLQKSRIILYNNFDSTFFYRIFH